MAKTRIENGKVVVNNMESFLEHLGDKRPENVGNFSDFIESLKDEIKKENPLVTVGALNNSSGDWYEFLILLGAWDFICNNNTNKIMLSLPNVSSFHCENLYVGEIEKFIVDFEKSLDKKGVSLVSSNPDFVILYRSLLPKIADIDALRKDLGLLTKFYKDFVGRCAFDDISGYCSAKTGLRPDRRLQIAHEGSLMKALYRHIQTRMWEIDAKGIQYFAITASATEADRNGLRTVATHSITDIGSKPQSAVDDLFVINSGNELNSILEKILN